ncbi:MAG: hypothetical protein WA821_05030 [Anaerolineales bacterium]
MPHLLAQIIPETGWVKFTPAEREQVLHNLDGFGAYGPPASAYLRAHNTAFGYLPQTASGAGWTLGNNLTLPPNTDLNGQRILAVIIHEVLHLQQPLITRLSVQGELLAWQLEYQAYHAGTGIWYGDPGAPFAGAKPFWDALSQLSPDSHEHLARAQRLMKEVSPAYRSDLLPLYPLGREAGYRLANSLRRPKNR